jgi:hypothetical protein
MADKKPRKLCRLCRFRPAEVPDRDRDLTWRKSICRECHGERLRGDMVKALRAHQEAKR